MISTFWTKDFTSRRELYAEMEAVTGNKFEGHQYPYSFNSQVLSDYGNIWEFNAKEETRRLNKAIADARSEWVSISNGGRV